MNYYIEFILGIIIGFVIYCLIYNRPVIKGPNSKDIVGKIFIVNNKKYVFEPFIVGYN
jgi:hypothetical protein